MFTKLETQPGVLKRAEMKADRIQFTSYNWFPFLFGHEILYMGKNDKSILKQVLQSHANGLRHRFHGVVYVQNNYHTCVLFN